MDKYTFVKELGKGTYGRVCLMQNKETKKLEAIKFIHREKAGNVLNEVKNHIICACHPNILKFNNIMFVDNFFCLCLEYAEKGDMFEYLKTQPNRRFEEAIAKPIFKQLLTAISHCHSLGVFHRDIKLENILLHETGNIKICDFGYALDINDKYDPERIVGTLSYLAPECIVQKVEDCTKIDVWSCGVVLFCMLCGHYPFQDAKDPNDIKLHILNICQANYKLPLHIGEEARELFKSIFTLNPAKRPSAADLLSHAWLGDTV